MEPEVSLRSAVARRTLVVPVASSWQDFPGQWRPLLDEVWDCLRAAGVTSGCPNVMLFRDDVPHVEVGVLCDLQVPLTGRVVVSALPAGPAAVAVHAGPFADVGGTHDAVVRWCLARGHRPTRTRWEVYGPHDDDPGQQRVEVGWSVAG